MCHSFKRFILDIDDTLYLERDYVLSGFRAVGEAIRLPRFGEICWDLFLSGVRGNTFDLARERLATSDIPDTETLVQIYRSHVPKIALCDDARRFLESRIEPVAMISDGALIAQRAKFQALNLVPWIDYPIFTEEIGAPKPSIRPFYIARMALDVESESIAYIADNPKKDFDGARKLGIASIRIRRRQSLHENEETPNFAREITSFDEL